MKEHSSWGLLGVQLGHGVIFFNAYSLAFCAHCRRVALLCYSCGPSRAQNALFSIFYQNESISLSKDGGTCQNGILTAVYTMYPVQLLQIDTL